MKNEVRALGLVAVLTAGLMGCSSSNSSNTGTDLVVKSTFDPALCTVYLPTTGNAAALSNVKLSRPVTSAYFEKRYNRAMLESVLEASGVETQNFVKASGIPLYKVPTPSAGCLFQHDLDPAPQALQDQWDRVAGGSHGEGHLAGLFLGYSADLTAIMVREDAGRWTLIHEMMHANFFRQRIADGVLDGTALRSAIQSSLAQLRADLRSYTAKPNEEDAAKLEAGVMEAAKLLYQSLASGSLEEIADESQLLEDWSAGRLKFVTNSAARNAAWYINYSHTSALDDLNDFTAKIASVRDYVLANVPENRTDDLFKDDTKAEFQKSLDLIQSVNKMANDFNQLAKDRTASLEPRALFSAASIHPALVEITNPHLAAMNNTPAMRDFRRFSADLFN